jgi:hypothetical protein
MGLFSKKGGGAVVRQSRALPDQGAFRRSQTLTGSSSPSVRAVGDKQQLLQSERLKKQALHRKRQLLLFILCAVLLVSGATLWLISQYIVQVPTPQYASIASPGVTADLAYKQSITSYLQKRPSERFYFSVDTAQLTQYIAQLHPEVKSVDVVGRNFTMTLRQPVVVWKVGDTQYFVDKEGYSFEANYFAAPTVSVQDKTGVVAENGQIASRRFLGFIGRMVAMLNESGLGQVTEVTLPPNTTRQIDFKIEGKSYYIKTHSDREPSQEIEDLRRVDTYLAQKGINPEYIDLRIKGRAYYK